MDPQQKAQEWARVLKGNWEELARSPYRDFFVASHRGWDDPRTWQEEARFATAIVLHELSAEALAALDVLELGCGVGRLAAEIAPRVRSYTGFDIAAPMVAEARARQGALPRARFFVGEGSRVPDAARDRRYGLAFASAVFIHCPKDLIAILVTDVCSLLAPGGEFRFQLRADAADPTGIAPESEAPLDMAPPPVKQGALDERESADLHATQVMLNERYYMGDVFRYAEVAPFLAAACPQATPRLLRFDREHIYVDLRVP